MRIFTIILFLFISIKSSGQEISGEINEYEIGKGWAGNSVNAVIFRKNSVVTHKNIQYAAYYDQEKYVVLAKRKSGSSKWETARTQYQGNTHDAHNSISIMVDGKGYLHMAWDHHNDSLRYARSVSPGSLQLSEKMPMTGRNEVDVTYPEFYKMPNGDLLFFYRYGESGRGDLVINRYDLKSGKWEQLQSNLIDGEGARNAYWQACVDRQGTIHISWVWRETWDVATNHDLCYARSRDGGKSWENSKGVKYQLPITQKTAEIAFEIPQNSELINQTSMTAGGEGNPVIATYWRAQDSEIPQFRVVYFNGTTWHGQKVFSRQTPFSLSGGGTKSIPISRPQILVGRKGSNEIAVMIFRDLERGNKPSVAVNAGFPSGKWEVMDLSNEDLGAWEPSYDTELWNRKGVLSLFVQKVEQVDAEGLADSAPQMVKLLEWKPLKY